MDCVTPEQVAASCAGKKRYDAYSGADKVLKRMRRATSKGKSREPRNVYRCPVCRGFHIGFNNERLGS